MTDLIKQLQYLSRVTKDYDQEHMTSADYEMIPTVTKQAADRIEEVVKERDGLLRVVTDNHVALQRAEAAETKLDKAVEALRFYSPQTVGGITFVGGDDAGKRAAAALAELKGK